MPETQQGPEPRGWELMRAIRSVEQTLRDQAQTYLPLAIHALLVERVKDIDEDATAKARELSDRIKGEHDAREKAIAELKLEADNAKKTRAQTWTAIGLLFVGGIVTLFMGVLRQGIGLP